MLAEVGDAPDQREGGTSNAVPTAAMGNDLTTFTIFLLLKGDRDMRGTLQ